MLTLTGKYTDAVIHTKAEPLETAVIQIQQLIDHPVSTDTKVRIMPDYHAGTGCVIGTTMKLVDKVSPSLVGVDIGCGVLCYKFEYKNLNLNFLDNYIRNNIPHGRFNHAEYSDLRQRDWFNAENFHAEGLDSLKINKGLGTLGGGNHFIELGKDEEGYYYLFIHTGSRYLGAKVANYYQELAVEQTRRDLLIKNSNTLEEVAKIMGSHYEATLIMRSLLKPMTENETRLNLRGKALLKEFIFKLKALGRHKEINTFIVNLKEDAKNVVIEDPSLCYLTGENYNNYLHDMELAQKYAKTNRMLIANQIMLALEASTIERFDSIHNYIDTDTNTLRKGAISAQEGEKLLIPLNMRDGVIIGVGKGNPDWNYSAPHGAGRLVSRTQSKKDIKLEDFQQQMEGVFSTCVADDTIDESPNAYKPMEHILDVINDTVDILKIVKPVYNFKASE